MRDFHCFVQEHWMNMVGYNRQFVINKTVVACFYLHAFLRLVSATKRFYEFFYVTIALVCLAQEIYLK